jgi:tetratricopeptide (TPR) repeat protein
LKINEATDYREGIANDWGNLGGLYILLGKYSSAQEAHERALQIHRALKHRYGIAKDVENLALVAFLRKDFQTALEYARQALRAYRRLGSPHEQATALLNLAVIYQHLNKLQLALRLQHRARRLVRRLGAPDALFRALVGRGDTYAKLGQMRKAERDWRGAVALLESARGRLIGETRRVHFWQGGQASVYADLVLLLARRRNRAVEAWEWMGRAKSRALLEQLAQTDLNIQSKRVPRRIAEQERMLRTKLRVQENALRLTSIEDESQSQSLRELMTTYSEWQQLLTHLQRRAPEWVAMRRGESMVFAALTRILRS